jgi:chromosomal replication initiator protein
MNTLTHWIETAESRSGLLAIRRVVECVSSFRKRREINPLFLHGPSGTGKTHLITSLIEETTGRRPDLVATVLAASDLGLALRPDEEGTPPGIIEEANRADLLVIEDLQHLAGRAVEPLVGIIDERSRRQQQMVFTASQGPGQLRALPARLTSRLAAGLVVGLSPLSPESRRSLLRQLARRDGLTLNGEALDWVADRVAGSVRQLEGALGRLETLYRLHGRPATLPETQAAFEEDAEARQPTVERIAQRVSSLFQVETKQLKTRERSRHVLLPRQVGMYLARKLTTLSLEQIGAYFGGRDHSTVLHACRKVELALTSDPRLSGIVRQLHADLA